MSDYAVLNDNGLDEYGDVFEGEKVPVKHIIDYSGTSHDPDSGDEIDIRVYMVDYEELTEEEQENVKKYIMETFDVSEEKFLQDLEEMGGVPIRTKWVSHATTTSPERYL